MQAGHELFVFVVDLGELGVQSGVLFDLGLELLSDHRVEILGRSHGGGCGGAAIFGGRRRGGRRLRRREFLIQLILKGNYALTLPRPFAKRALDYFSILIIKKKFGFFNYVF